jgi:HlyD family secretion protein
MRNAHRVTLAGFMIAGVVIGIAGCGLVRSSDHTETAPPPEQWIHGVGYVEPVGEVRRLAFKHAGIVAHCCVEIGQRVAAGERLMTLRATEERAALGEAEAAVVLAEAELAQVRAGVNSLRLQSEGAAKAAAEADAAYAEQAFVRQRTLRDTRASSPEQFDLAQAELRRKQAIVKRHEAELGHLENYVRETDVAVAVAKLRSAEARLTTARERLAETELRAPHAGVVLELLRREGEATDGGASEPVMIFADPTQLRVRAEIDETQALTVHEGTDAIISGPPLDGREFFGRVTLVKPLMGKKTVFAQTATERKDLGARQVFIDLPPNTELPLGLEVDVRIESGKRPGVSGMILQRGK